MGNLFKIAIRNLFRYKRRTLLTASLITIGVVFVLAYISVSGSFKNMMIGQITDSMLGHLQVHRKGYVASIDNLAPEFEPEAPGRQEAGGRPEEPAGGGSLFPPDQIRRHVQQFCGNHQYPAQRGLSGAGIQNGPPASDTDQNGPKDPEPGGDPGFRNFWPGEWG